MNDGLLIFGGTSEGRELCELLSRHGRTADVFTATDYGRDMVRDLAHITVHSGRLDAAGMSAFIRERGIATVIDATHPYARDVTLNITEACAATGAAYVRVIRGEGEYPGIRTVENIAAAVDFLSTTEGAVLLSTGSKELGAFCRLPDYQTRLYARVLPVAEVLRHCATLGFSGSHIIAMQGPFSYELNLAMLRHFHCRFLVTKNTGTAGGMDAKIAAARDAGVETIIVDRPLRETGFSFPELCKHLGLDSGV